MKIFGYEIRKAEKRGYSPFSDALTFSTLRNSYSAMNISAVYRAVEIISDSIGILPIRIKSNKEKHKDEIPTHSLNMVFAGRGGILSRYSFMKLLIQSVLLNGNGFAYIERGEDGTVLSLRFLESDTVQIYYNNLTGVLYYTCSAISKGKIEPINMIHLVKNSYDGVNGLSVLQYASRTIKLASNTENSASGFFENGCNLSGVLTVQGQLTDKQKQDIRASWNQAYINGGNGLAILQGNMEYKPIQLSAADSQLLESRVYNVQDIARFFGISPVLLGDLSHSSYNTIEATQNQFVLHTLMPYVVMIEEEFTRKLIKPSEEGLIIDLDETAILKTDKQALASYYGTLLQNGVLCIDEVRKELGYSPIGATEHIIPYTDITQNNVKNGGNKEG